MGSLTSPKLGALAIAITRRTSCNLSPLATQGISLTQERYSHEDAKDKIKKGLSEAAKIAGGNLKDQACLKSDEVFDDSKEKAQGVAERAKQVAQDAWGSAKGTANKVSDSVRGKAEQSQGAIKGAAEKAKESMNTKKDL